MPSFNPGALVLYHGKSACVTAVTKDKIEIRIEGGNTKSVRTKDIEFLHPGPAASLPPAVLPAPDAGELIELIEGEQLPFAEFAELAYGSRSAAAFYSAWLLLQDGTCFTGSKTASRRVRAKRSKPRSPPRGKRRKSSGAGPN